jgi:transcriptional regulator
MGRMDDRLLRIFIMRFCGASHSDVAHVLGCSRQNAGYLWLRALDCIPSLDEIEAALDEVGNPSPASFEPVAV